LTVKVVTDSACDLPQELADELGITIVPLTVRFGEEEFLDRRDLTAAEFWARCDASPTLPETAAPSPGAFEAAFRSAADEGHDGVVAVLLSGGLSATLQAAQVAADAVSDVIRVRTVDSQQASAALGVIALNAARWAATGGKVDEIADGAQAFLGSMLSMKPVIELVDGVVEPESRQRTRGRSIQHLAAKVREAMPVEHLLLLHADAPDHEELLGMISELVPRDDIIVTKIGAVIGTHAGPRAMGVAFQVPPS